MVKTVSSNVLQYHANQAVQVQLNACVKMNLLVTVILTIFWHLFKLFDNAEVHKSYVITRLSIYDNQKAKGSMTLTPDPDFLLRLLHEPINITIIVTITFTVVKKKYHQFFFKIKGGSLIVNLILLSKCDLRKVSSRLR